ncbi:bpX6 domain-containing protein [Kitasatospora sp. NPDC096147]|uniref:bpX6 domain-containing protein n=1 Tax=Kitasatospora sp. NPDC096147 TaxID=3364093 RepID=UPI00380D3BDF
MTTTPETAFRAVVRAVGFVLDVPVIGPAEAAERVLARWQDGAELHRLPDGRWLFTLADAVEIRADRAPGLPVVRTATGGAATVGADADADAATAGPAAGRLALAAGGLTTVHPVAELERLDPAAWLDLTGLTVHRPRPLGPPAPEAAPVVDALPTRPRPDLRAAARIAPPSDRARRLTAGPEQSGRARRSGRAPRRARPEPRSRWGRLLRSRAVALGSLVLLLLPVLWLVLTTFGSTSRPGFPPWGIGVLLAYLLAGARTWWTGRPTTDAAGPDGTGTGTGSDGTGADGTADGASAAAGTGRPSAVTTALARLRARWATGRTTGTGTARRRATGRSPRTPLLASVRARRAARQAGTEAAAGTEATAWRRPLLAPLLTRLTMRAAGGLVRDRHERYLRELTRAFRQRQWEDALRDAIRLTDETAAEGKTWQTLTLPRRRVGELRATPGRGAPGGASVPLSGHDVHEHLGALYRAAAEELQRAGRIDEAAFVLADLLDAPAEAVALLARHDRLVTAAELAEGRELAADLVVRLWWRAGERERAVRTAHRRGAFAAAVERLSIEQPQDARELRTAWAEHCRVAGDRLAAVEALWPDRALRPAAAADLREAVALGGATRSHALPYLLALGAGDATRALALAVLESEGDPAVTGRAVLVGGLARLPAADPAADRELATAAARAVVRDGAPTERQLRDVHEKLLKRADPLVAADLARPRRPEPAPRQRGTDVPAPGPVRHTATDRPGTLPVLDAAVLGSGAVLVACGHAGVRLLTPDGRTKARWDVPADQLVLADHGGSAVLVADHGGTKELTRLDLATRTVRSWTTLRAQWIARSYDGRHLITGDGRGIVVLDALAPGPTVVWRELGGGERLVGTVSRTADGCAGVVVSHLPGGEPLVELWHWELPGWELRSRQRLEERFDPGRMLPLPGTGLLLAAPGPADELSGERPTVLWLVGGAASGHPVTGTALAGPLGDGGHWALPVRDEAGTGILLHAGRGPVTVPAATVHFPGADPTHLPGLRRHGDTVTYWHRSGRVLATSEYGTELRTDLRVGATG